MRLMRRALRVWIGLTSAGAFLAGWTLLAHAPKPAPLQFQAGVSATAMLEPLPTLPPLAEGSLQLQPLPSLPRSLAAFPRLRTSGS
jgi:hypothetical protein